MEVAPMVVFYIYFTKSGFQFLDFLFNIIPLLRMMIWRVHQSWILLGGGNGSFIPKVELFIRFLPPYEKVDDPYLLHQTGASGSVGMIQPARQEPRW